MSIPANSINEATTGIVGFTSTAFTATPVTAHDVLLGGATSSTIAQAAPSATSGIPLVSNGASSDPSFTTAVVAGGGTGDTSFTAYSVICGGTSSTGALQNVSGVGSSTQVLTSNGAAALPTWQSVTASGAITTITGNSGGAESPSAGNFNVLGTGSITIAGTANTETVQLTGLTRHNVLVGAGTDTITKVAPSATSGVPLVSGGSSADPSFTTAVVAGGGTGAVTLTNHGVLIGQATSAISATAAGSAGQVLQSGGASADPSYSTATYPSTAGTSGNILKSDGTNFTSSAPSGVGGLVLIQTVTATNQASLAFTTGFGTYNRVKLVGFIIPLTTDGQVYVQFSTNGGSSYQTSGYQSCVNYTPWNSTTFSQGSISAGLAICDTTDHDQTGILFDVTLYNLNGANTFGMTGTTTFDNAGNTAWQLGFCGGIFGANLSVNALRIISSAGNVTGTVSLYGFAN